MSSINNIYSHRTLAILHISAMVAQAFLAKNAVKNGKKYDDLMDAHLKAGTIAFFTLSLDMLGLTFLNEKDIFNIVFTVFLCSVF